jgi:ubiquinone biosynthesis protein COQ9
MDQTNTMDHAKDAVLDAALPHVAFDGWSAATLRAATADSGVAPALVAALFPRGAVDLALAYHHRGDTLMRERFAAEDLTGLRYSEKVARAVRLRLEVASDKEAVRRGTTLFALPQHSADGARAIWGTADAIWTALGDTSNDLNWYSKRAVLSAVYGTTVLFWLGDDSPDQQATWEFLDRRIENVMSFEKFKSSLRDNPISKAFAAGPGHLFDKIKAPKMPDDLPGSFMDRFRN